MKIPGAGNGGIVPPPEYRWKKGQTGNPKGRPAAGATIREWMTIMVRWPLARVESVLNAPNCRLAKRIAARVIVDAASRETSKTGVPIAGPEFDRIMDRTLGRPKQEVELTGHNGGALAIEAGPRIDYSKLSTEELSALERILAKAVVSGEPARAALPDGGADTGGIKG